MALAIEQAIGAYEDDGGIKGEPPMLCAMVIVAAAMDSEDPKGFVSAIHAMMMIPFGGPVPK